jgi:demethylmenaquinone methyltransferase/2-methoxy-6-polyprenyl-1,4-benzoquinol methylase
MPKDAALEEQLEYYRARAREYDQWWLREGRYDRGAAANAQWFSDASHLVDALRQFRPSGRILELACGTGIWSEKLLRFSSSLTVIDGSREMLGIARSRLRSPNVEYVEANIFDWEPTGQFDTVFFSFWLSHVPPGQFSDFWQLVARCLARRGRVFFLDSCHEPTSTANDHQLPGSEAITLRRRLNDGREFSIYKIFYDPRELESRLADIGWQFDVATTGKYFIYGQGHRKGA